MKKTLLILILLSSHFIPCYTQNNVINTIVGNGHFGYTGDGGPASVAEIYFPSGITIDAKGNIFFSDDENNVIRRINTSGIITTIVGNGYNAGTGYGGYSGDSGPATAAELYEPHGIWVDGSSNIYIVDLHNSCVRKVNTSGIITTIAGICNSYISGYTGDGGSATAAELYDPESIVFDTKGNLYITDTYNNCIRKVDTGGIITTFAGTATAGYSGDGGPASNAEIYFPTGIAIDKFDNLYFSDYGNERIRKISSSGIITTIAGNGYGGEPYGGYSGDGGAATAAELYFPEGLCLDTLGNVYLADEDNQRIRMISTTGIITTYAGDGTPGFFGDGGPPAAAELATPTEVACDISGNIYIGDFGNARIRETHFSAAGVNTISNSSDMIKIYPNPSNGKFILQVNSDEGLVNSVVEVYNVLGEKVYSRVLATNHYPLSIDLTGKPTGIYFYRISMSTRILVSEGRFIINN